MDAMVITTPIHLKRYIFGTEKGGNIKCAAPHLQEVPPLVHLLDVFVGKDAACPLELAGALPGSPGDDRFVHATRRRQTKPKGG